MQQNAGCVFNMFTQQRCSTAAQVLSALCCSVWGGCLGLVEWNDGSVCSAVGVRCQGSSWAGCLSRLCLHRQEEGVCVYRSVQSGLPHVAPA